MEYKLLEKLSEVANYIKGLYYPFEEKGCIFQIDPNSYASAEYYVTSDFDLFVGLNSENTNNIILKDAKFIPKYSFAKYNLKSALKISAKLAFNKDSSKIVSSSFLLKIVEFFKDKPGLFSICILAANKILINRHYDFDEIKFTHNKLDVYLFSM